MHVPDLIAPQRYRSTVHLAQWHRGELIRMLSQSGEQFGSVEIPDGGDLAVSDFYCDRKVVP
nr:hypothetical protein GCM10025732_08630 [Glycomyces mayteni]